MEKIFVLTIFVIAIIGFCASAYVFSQTDVIADITNISDNTSDKKTQVINEINKCINENTVDGNSIHFNSFEKNFLSNIIMQIENTDNEEELDRILEQLYSISSCKHD